MACKLMSFIILGCDGIMQIVIIQNAYIRRSQCGLPWHSREYVFGKENTKAINASKIRGKSNKNQENN